MSSFAQSNGSPNVSEKTATKDAAPPTATFLTPQPNGKEVTRAPSIPRNLSFSALDNVSGLPGTSLNNDLKVSSNHVIGSNGTNSNGATSHRNSSVEPVSAQGPEFQFGNPIIPAPTYTWTPGVRAETSKQTNVKDGGEEEEIDYLKLILNARVYDVAIESPLQLAKNLSTKLGNKLYLKREDMQPIFSFKCRGAFNRMVQLSREDRERGVIAVSAGNHAQGVALAAQKLGIKATIVMPTFAPSIKVQNVKRLGANVVLFGNDFDDAKKECQRLALEHGYVFIPPFDDPYVIAGQGTVGVEILRQLKEERCDAIFIAVGGGGLLAGVAAFIKRIRPEIKLIGVNTIDSTAMTTSLQLGERQEMTEVGLFSDGTSVRLVGKENFKLCQQFVDDMILVSNDELCAAIKECYEDTRSILEPAGALSLAGCKRYLLNNPQIKNGVFISVLSGANMNFDRLQFVAERARIGEGKEALLSVLIPEQPGTLCELHNVIYPRYVRELSYRYWDEERAHVYVGFDVQDAEEVGEIMKKFNEKGWTPLDISDDELAKSHGRFLVGGRSNVSNELLYRFQFPERPGALRKFFTLVSSRYNISLFHYRNHGADMAKVLMGVQVPEENRDDFRKMIEGLGYSYTDESSNPVYQHFLR